MLRASVSTIAAFMRTHLPGRRVTIVVADNGSTDDTPRIGRALAAEDPSVEYLRVPSRGKGIAIRTAWRSFEADAYAFMDVDLSTGLSAFPALIERLEQGADIAVGSRFHPDSLVERGALRRIISGGYRFWLRSVLGVGFSDAPCGFKAVTKKVVDRVLPDVRDDEWFFDSELMVRAERRGFVIVEVPVEWKDARDEGRAS
ncbi:MAG TPA: glycosyltransferase, partial [Burkholderiales bacterium]|nr:glycosyltransferase [Burkholderiales bacterium]